MKKMFLLIGLILVFSFVSAVETISPPSQTYDKCFSSCMDNRWETTRWTGNERNDPARIKQLTDGYTNYCNETCGGSTGLVDTNDKPVPSDSSCFSAIVIGLVAVGAGVMLKK